MTQVHPLHSPVEAANTAGILFISPSQRQVLLYGARLLYAGGVAPRAKSKPELVKTEDVEYHLRCASGTKAIYREEVWEDRAGRVVKYNLAFIQHTACGKDHGRLVGYDNAHGHHERHFMGKAQAIEFVSYEQTLKTFQDEVRHYRETT